MQQLLLTESKATQELINSTKQTTIDAQDEIIELNVSGIVYALSREDLLCELLITCLCQLNAIKEVNTLSII